MVYNKENLKQGEVVYWQGTPCVSCCNVKTFGLYVIPALILLYVWSGASGIEEYLPFLKEPLDTFQNTTFAKYIALVLIAGLLASPFVRWFLYYKRIEYVFTNMRALAYYKDDGEIEFEIEASEIPDMKQSSARNGLVNLHTWMEDSGMQGKTVNVRAGFEGIPAEILKHYT